MIESFRHKGLKRFYQEDDRGKLPPGMVDRIAIILAALDAAATIAAMNRPSFRLHRLKGDLKGRSARARQGQLADRVPL